MSKIQTITLKNFKGISDQEVDFKGCTAIITAGNNKGKTSLLRGIPDRIRFTRPEVMVKRGEKEGMGELTLDSGEKFEWEFNVEGKDKLTYITSKGIKQNVTKELGKQFFPPTFDIDKFLQSSPKEQSKQLQLILGIDFTDVDARYLVAYNDRTEKNRESEKYHVKLSQMLKVDEIRPVDLTELQIKKEAEKKRINDLYLSNKSINDRVRKEWGDAKTIIDNDVREFNHQENQRDIKRDNLYKGLEYFEHYNYPDVKTLLAWIETTFPPKLPAKVASELYPKEPEYITEMPDDAEMILIDSEILSASETNTKAKAYSDYITYKQTTEEAKTLATQADELVKSIEAERQNLIESANFPKGVSITSEGITVDSFPLDRNQISASKLYTTALRIGSMNLGEVKSLYFDASLLDRNSLLEIELWAAENKLQLLIERADFDGGEIKYELIEN